MRELAPLSVRNQPVRVNRVVSVVALLVIVGLVGNSQAADYKSGWYVGESGSELNLNSAESFGEQIWVFGDSGLILISSDFGQTWTPTASPISEDIHYSDSAFGALAIAGNSGILLLKQDVNSDWVELPLSESIN